MAKPYLLAESAWSTVRHERYTVAIVPWGATEAHNLHLPYGTDTFQAAHVAAESARLAWERGARTVVLPAVPFGVQTGQLEVPLCLNMNPSTQLALLADLADTVSRAGIANLVLLNGHGGNDFKPIIRELQPRTPLFLSVVNWWTCVDPAGHFEEPGDHAGELETSVMLEIAPALVAPLADAGPGAARPWRIRALREGWAWASREWHHATADTGIGDPRRATADKGARFLAAVCERVADYLVDLAASQPGDRHVDGDAAASDPTP